jgi:Beta-propeller repeat.
MKRAERPNWANLLAATVIAAGLATPVAATADDSRLQWVRQLGTSKNDFAYGVATDTAGNVYLAGETYGDLAGPNQGIGDAWVAKVDAANHVVWKRQLGTSRYDTAYDVATDAFGNVYLTGETYGDLAGPNQDGDAWVAKYDTDGHRKWKRQLGSSRGDYATGVATDIAGNVYVTGTTSGDLAGPNQGDRDAWLARYDANGRRIWKRQLGTPSNDEAYDVATDDAGNIYLAGWTYGDLAGPNQGDLDAWVAKYDATGQLRWKRQLGSSDMEQAYGVATDTAGNVYVAGYTYGALFAPKQGYGDAWLAKYDADGNRKWQRQLGGSRTDYATGVATDMAGNVYLTGGTDGDLSGPNHGATDAWLATYDPDGHPIWTQQLGTANDDFANRVATFTHGDVTDVYITGYTSGALCGAFLGGAGDAFVAKYASEP